MQLFDKKERWISWGSELELKGKNQELNQLEDDKKLLEEELEVVKVLSGQLQDLNSVLEDTKKGTKFKCSEY